MNNISYPIDPARSQAIFHEITDQDADLLSSLIALQTARGIDEQTAEENALHCVEAVASHEGLKEALSENAQAVLDKVFTALARKKPEQRLEALHQFYFGLTAHDNPDILHHRNQGFPLQDFYQIYRDSADPAITAEELEDQIRQAFSRYRFPAHVLWGIPQGVKHREGYLATAEALGVHGRYLKCLLAMDLWLNSQDTMTMEEAAASAVTSVESQAVTDALNRGYVTRDVAMVAIAVLGLALATFGMIQFASYLPEAIMSASELAATGGTLADAEAKIALARKWVFGGVALEIGGLSLNEISGKLAERLGSFAIGLPAMLRKADPEAEMEEVPLEPAGEVEMGYVEPNPSLFVSIDLPDEEDDDDLEQAVF